MMQVYGGRTVRTVRGEEDDENKRKLKTIVVSGCQLEKISVLNFPTKDHWRSPSRLSYVIDGLNWFVENYEKFGIDSIAFPPLGCGNGGLSWSVVGPIMYQKLSKLTIDIEIYAPFGTSLREITEEFLSNSATEYEALANANLIVERQLGRMISLSVSEGVELQRDKFTEEERNAVKKTVDLFGRVKSTDQAEMIATVLYSYDQLTQGKIEVSDKDVYDFVLDWKPHWKVEKDFDLCETIQNMAMLSLMNVSCSGELMDTMLV